MAYPTLEQAIVQMKGVAKKVIKSQKAAKGWNEMDCYIDANDFDTTSDAVEDALIATFVGKMMVMPFMAAEMAELEKPTLDDAWNVFAEQYWAEMGETFFLDTMGYNCMENWVAFNELGNLLLGNVCADDKETMTLAMQYLYDEFAEEEEEA